MGKRPLCHTRTAKVQLSENIRAVWSEHSLYVNIHLFTTVSIDSGSRQRRLIRASDVRKLHTGLFRVFHSFVQSIAPDKMLFFHWYVWIFFLFFRKNICCGYSLEVPQGGTSNEYTQHMFTWRNKETNFLDTPLCIYIYMQSCRPFSCETTIFMYGMRANTDTAVNVLITTIQEFLAILVEVIMHAFCTD